MFVAIGGGDFHYATLGCENALEDDEAAGWLDGLFEGLDDDLAGSLSCECGFFSEGTAADGERRAVGVACVDEALREEARSTCRLKVRSHVLARRNQIADER